MISLSHPVFKIAYYFPHHCFEGTIIKNYYIASGLVDLEIWQTLFMPLADLAGKSCHC